MSVTKYCNNGKTISSYQIMNAARITVITFPASNPPKNNITFCELDSEDPLVTVASVTIELVIVESVAVTNITLFCELDSEYPLVTVESVTIELVVVELVEVSSSMQPSRVMSLSGVGHCLLSDSGTPLTIRVGFSSENNHVKILLVSLEAVILPSGSEYTRPAVR